MSDEAVPSQATPGDHVADIISSIWWLMLLRGIVMIALGGYALFTPGLTLVALTQVLAIFAIIDGVLAIVAGAMGWVESRWWTLLRGVLGIVVGLFVFVHPIVVGTIAAMIIIFVIAFQSIAGGILEIIVAIRERKKIEGEGWLILAGVVSIIFGVVLLMAPLLAAAVFIQVFGVFAIIFGIALIVQSFRLRKVGKKLASA